ncbi:MAG: lytic transglycosylase domain-containing protein [Clostridia bacterium]|nr:lytic transglycosylase domain-containing protein [Clostridia bacterium]
MISFTKKVKHAFIIIGIFIVALAVGLIYQHIYNIRQFDTYPQKYSEYVATASIEFNVPEQIIYATIKTESNFQPNAKSSAGAIGLMQLMPDTFEWLTDSMLCENLPPHFIYDPKTNIRYGTYMLSWLYDRFGDWETVFAAYNAGIGNVNSWLSDERYSSDGKLTNIPFAETRGYVKRQLEHIKKYENLYYTGE